MSRIVTNKQATHFPDEQSAVEWIKANVDPSIKYKAVRSENFKTFLVEAFHKGSGFSRGYIVVDIEESKEKETLSADILYDLFKHIPQTHFVELNEISICSADGQPFKNVHFETFTDKDGITQNKVIISK